MGVHGAGTLQIRSLPRVPIGKLYPAILIWDGSCHFLDSSCYSIHIIPWQQRIFLNKLKRTPSNIRHSKWRVMAHVSTTRNVGVRPFWESFCLQIRRWQLLMTPRLPGATLVPWRMDRGQVEFADLQAVCFVPCERLRDWWGWTDLMWIKNLRFVSFFAKVYITRNGVTWWNEGVWKTGVGWLLCRVVVHRIAWLLLASLIQQGLSKLLNLIATGDW